MAVEDPVWAHPLRQTWYSMVDRCSNESDQAFAHYGGRGISVCDRWRVSFDAFVLDMGPRPSAGHSLDRIDNDGNYEPANCRWATQKQQANNMRSNRRIAHDGRTMTVSEWADASGVPYFTLMNRIKRGWDMARALQPEHGKTGARNPRRGQANGGRFSDEQVATIVRRLHAGEKAIRLSEEYGVTRAYISQIKNGKTWRHIQRPEAEAA